MDHDRASCDNILQWGEAIMRVYFVKNLLLKIPIARLRRICGTLSKCRTQFILKLLRLATQSVFIAALSHLSDGWSSGSMLAVLVNTMASRLAQFRPLLQQNISIYLGLTK